MQKAHRMFNHHTKAFHLSVHLQMERKNKFHAEIDVHRLQLPLF